MNPVEEFVFATAATERFGIPGVLLATQHGWTLQTAEAESQFAYVLEDHFGIQVVNAGVFANIAIAPGDDLQRSVVIDASGLIGHFAASNMSVVLAQPAGALRVSRQVLLKRNTDPAQYREDNVRTYIISDPFEPLRDELAQIDSAEPIHTQTRLSPIAISNAARVLDAAVDQSVLPTKILRGSSSVFVYFSNRERYAEVECENDGDIGVVLSDRTGKPKLWLTELSHLRSDLATIRAFLI